MCRFPLGFDVGEEWQCILEQSFAPIISIILQRVAGCLVRPRCLCIAQIFLHCAAGLIAHIVPRFEQNRIPLKSNHHFLGNGCHLFYVLY